MVLEDVREVPHAAPSKSGLRQQATVVALTAISFFVCASISNALQIRAAGVVFIWLPSGLLLALLLILQRRNWPSILITALAMNFATDLFRGESFGFSAIASSINTLEAGSAAWLIQQWIRPHVSLGALREVGAFFLIAIVICDGLAAAAGAPLLSKGAGAQFGSNWFIWWAADGLGMLALTPAILTVRELLRHPNKINRWCALEALVTLSAIALFSQFLMVHKSDAGISDPAFMVFPLLIWSAVRFGPWGAGLATLVLCSISAWGAAHVEGLFGTDGASLVSQVRDMYTYLGLASLSTLVPASILHERIAATQQSAESEKRLRQMAEHIQEAFFVIEVASGNALYTSPTWSEIWGRPIDAPVAHNLWYESIHPEDIQAVRSAQSAVCAGHASSAKFRVLRPNGTTCWVRARVFPVRNEAGAVYRYVGVAEDITDRLAAEQKFAQSQKMDAVGRLAGGVAHDFNNLLTVILSYSDLLLPEFSESDPRRGDILAIRGAGESAAALTRQLLMFSRQEVLQPRPLKLNELVKATGKMLERLIGENIELVLALRAEGDEVLADPGQLEQVIVNLAVNARDAMPAGGKLLIESADVKFAEKFTDLMAEHPAGSYVMIAVSDTGSGMNAVTQARMFEPFFTTKDPGKGTGLGLSTVYGIIQANGGFISVYSELGKGTAFKIYLPHSAALVPAVEALPIASPLPVGTETVLVVEDDPAVRQIVRNVLERQGYEVLAVADGSHAIALTKARQGRIDLLLTDVVMPGMSGRALSDEFATMRPNAKTLFVSGYTDDAIVRHGILESEVEYLAKPFTSGALARKVRAVLDDAAPSKRMSDASAISVLGATVR